MRRVTGALLLTGLWTQPALSQTLWPEIPTGASPAQVQDLRPAARPSQGPPVAGRQERLTESGVVLAGQGWQARYYFDRDALMSVTLVPESGASAAREPLFDAVVEHFSATLGQPFNCAYGPSIGKHECDWRTAEHRLGVLLVTGLATPVLEVTYTPR